MKLNALAENMAEAGPVEWGFLRNCPTSTIQIGPLDVSDLWPDLVMCPSYISGERRGHQQTASKGII